MSKRRHLLVGAALSIFGFAGLNSHAYAQQQPPADDVVETEDAAEEAADEEDVIVVTGSRLRRTGITSTLPLVTVDAQYLEDRQTTNVLEALAELPGTFIGSSFRGANNQFGSNAAFIDELGCGSQRTLTLINGRRTVTGNQGTVFVPDNFTGAQVDFTALNPLIVESADRVTGAGGAAYGADAVCGVVNIKLKDDFSGAQFTAQGGITEFGDGSNFRVAGLFGRNFLNNRLNVTVGLEYSNADIIRNGNRPFDQGQSFTANPANGAQRNPAPFNPAQEVANLLAGGTLTPAFLGAGADNQSSQIFETGPIRNPQFPQGGLLVTATQATGGAVPGGGGTPFFPNTSLPGALAGGGSSTLVPFSFFAPSSLPAGVTASAVIAGLAPGLSITGLSAAQQTALAVNLLQRNRPTPFEFRQSNPNLDPLLFLARFQPTGLFPTVLNTNPATNAIFPRVAVPLRFDDNGLLTPFNVGTLTTGTVNDPNFPVVGAVIGGDGFNGEEFRTGNLGSGLDRGAFNLATRYDITNNIRYRNEVQFAEWRTRSNPGLQANGAVGASPIAGNGAIPIFIDQNPFFGAENLATVANLSAQGLAIPTQAGQRVLFVNRIFDDLTNFNAEGVRSGTDVRNIRTAHSLEGDFTALNREFFWDVGFVYGRNRIINISPQLLDVEFALATDVVLGANGQPVCRQQTLAAPEAINVRNPFLTNININTPGGLVPTQAQIDACVPLNVLGVNSADNAAARDYVLDPGDSRNLAQQFFGSAQFGGTLVELPAGPFSFTTNFEWRRESLVFTPGESFATGSARNTTGQPSDGVLRFFEGSFEGALPIFGKDLKLPFFNYLEFNGAVRVVSRAQSTQNPLFADFFNQPGTLNTTYQAGGIWSPIEDIVFRGNRNRSVRSASIVELFGAIGTGFSNGTGSVCTTQAITQGPNPALRRANCIEAVQLTGVADNAADAEAFLSTFTTAFNGQPASTGGTPGLQNEVADNWSVGVQIKPRFIPNLNLQADFIAVNLTGEIALAGPGVSLTGCFDASDFAAGDFTQFCDSLVFGVRNDQGVNVIPNVNPLTGNPLPPAAVAGQPATRTEDFQFAFVFFPNANLAARQIRAVNATVDYSFDLGDVFDFASNWGNIGLNGNVYWLRRFDIFTDGTPATLNPGQGDAFPVLSTRATISHRLGKFRHYLQWFRSSSTVGNVFTNPLDFDEQGLTFEFPSTNSFNYGATYQITDKLSLGIVANDITRATAFPEFAAPNQGIGRTFSVAINGRF
jgi:outer membrane receptor protein involved in Fe transport